MRRQRTGVDHGGHRICGVVEAVDEFETERNQKRHEQQNKRQVVVDAGAGRVDVDINTVGHEQQPGSDHSQIDDPGQWMKTAIEIRTLLQGWFDRTG
jgi:hypothetical protein